MTPEYKMNFHIFHFPDVQCRRPDTGKAELVLSPDSEMYNISTTVTVMCKNETKMLIGQSVMTCNTNGTWDQDLPSCYGKCTRGMEFLNCIHVYIGEGLKPAAPR